jgi:hypothetical protein
MGSIITLPATDYMYNCRNHDVCDDGCAGRCAPGAEHCANRPRLALTLQYLFEQPSPSLPRLSLLPVQSDVAPGDECPANFKACESEPLGFPHKSGRLRHVRQPAYVWLYDVWRSPQYGNFSHQHCHRDTCARLHTSLVSHHTVPAVREVARHRMWTWLWCWLNVGWCDSLVFGENHGAYPATGTCSRRTRTGSQTLSHPSRLPALPHVHLLHLANADSDIVVLCTASQKQKQHTLRMVDCTRPSCDVTCP